MQAVVDQEGLARGLKLVSVAGSAGDRHQGSTLLLEARGDELLLARASSEVAVRHTLDNRSPSTGQVVVPARPFERFVSSLRGEIAIAVEAGELVVTADRSSLRLRILDVIEGPRLPRVPSGAVALSDDDVAQVSRVTHAADRGGANPTLGAVRIGGTWAVASDGYRLAAARLEATVPQALLPLNLLRSVLSDADGTLVIGADDRAAGFEAGKTCWDTAVVAAPLWDWESLVPPASATPERLVADRRQILDAVRRVEDLGFGVRGTSYARLEITTNQDHLRVAAAEADLGDLAIDIDGEMTQGKLVFNAGYLREALEQSSTATVTCRSASAIGKPLVIDDDRLVQLVMPIRA